MKRVVCFVFSLWVCGCSEPVASGGDSGLEDGGVDQDAFFSGDQGLPDAAFPVCTEDDTKALLRYMPVDILWAIDGSPSDANKRDIAQYLNTLATELDTVGRGRIRVDYRIVVVASGTSESPSIQVAAPLGTDAMRYRFVGAVVSDPLVALRDEFPRYSSFLRPGSMVHIVAVSNTNSALTAEQFTAQYQALLGRGFHLHAIVSEDCARPPTVGAVCATPGPMNSCGRGGSPAVSGVRPGTSYLALQSRLDEYMNTGTWFSFCEADWLGRLPTFTLPMRYPYRRPCDFGVPAMTDTGRAVDVATSNVIAISGSDGVAPLRFPRVLSASACGTGQGWYFQPERGDEITLCPTSCEQALDREVRIAFGCLTEIR